MTIGEDGGRERGRAVRAAWSGLALAVCLATAAAGLGLTRGPVAGVARFVAGDL
jgi:hypothetical protein